MTRDEILHLAEQVGCGWARNGTEPVLIHGEKIVAFAALVASAEREACAQLVERNAAACRTHSELHDILSANALAIRARGEPDAP